MRKINEADFEKRKIGDIIKTMASIQEDNESDDRIELCENLIFKVVVNSDALGMTRKFVRIPYDYLNEQNDNACNIWTLSMNTSSKNTPIVLLHGFKAAIGSWSLNIDALGQSRPVYAIDLLGFGRSSRVNFSKDPHIIEQQFLNSIEEWRKAMNIDKFILMGHSFGAHLSTLYALHFRKRVVALILAEPWGLPDADLGQVKSHLSLIKEAVVKDLRDLRFKMFKKNPNEITQQLELIDYYKFLLNMQKPASGEVAFRASFLNYLCVSSSKRPLLPKIEKIDRSLPVWFIYGSLSWSDKSIANVIKSMWSNKNIFIKIIDGGDHMIISTKPNEFNQHVLEALKYIDENYAHVYSEKENTLQL